MKVTFRMKATSTIFLFWALVSAAAVISPFELRAAEETAELRKDAQRRLNYSGRQRMLSQRLIKTACLASVLPDNQKLVKEMSGARNLFYSSMKALRFGSKEMELMPETDETVLPLLDKSTALAEKYDGYLTSILSNFPKEARREELTAAYELSLPLLVALDDVVNQIQANHDDGKVVRPGLAQAINVSGRQRMLSQKMSKEVCMIFYGHTPKLTRAHLMGTIALFESSHRMLKTTLADMKLSAQDHEQISAQLELIEGHWTRLAEMFTGVSRGSKPTEVDLKVIATDSIKLLFELNRAVEMYENIDIAKM